MFIFLLLGTQVAEPPSWQDDCRALVDQGKVTAAAECYRHAAARDHDALALALAEVLTRVELSEPVLEAPRPHPLRFDLTTFALSGRAEVVGLGLLDGLGAGALLGGIAAAGRGQSPAVVFVFALPLVGGLGGFIATTGALMAFDEQLSDGDIHLLRAGLVVAGFEATGVALFLAPLTPTFAIIGGAALAAFGLSVGVSVGAAVLADVDPSAPSLALSFGWIGGVVGLLAANAADTKNPASLQVVATSLGVHAGLALGLALGSALPLSRPAILLVDAGAAVGLLGGSALAFGLNAPNPLLGYGTMATTTLVGAAVGFIGTTLLGSTPVLGAVPALVTPLMVGDGRNLGPGVGLVLALP